MNYSSRFFLYGPLALFLLITLGVGVIWWREASALSQRLDALNGREAIPGVTLHFASKTVGGFPFNIDVVFKDFRVEVKTPHGPSSWRAENFALHGLTYGREQLVFEAAGQQLLTWTDLQRHPHAMPFQAGELHASAIQGERGLARVDLDCIGFGSPALTAARAQLHLRVAPGGAAIEIAGAADAVHLSPQLASLFGDDIKEVRLSASGAPARAIDGLRAGNTDWVSALETWRKSNGALSVSDLEIIWDRVSAMGRGSLGLDDKHTVTGLLDFKLAGMEELVARARQRGVHGDSFRGIAAALLDRAGKAGNNEAGQLGAVVEFRTGIVLVGGEPATTEEPLY
jgi:hypothetical protein